MVIITKTKIVLCLLTATIFFSFPQKTYADTGILYDSRRTGQALHFMSAFTPAEEAFMLFENLFQSPSEHFIPKGTRVLGVWFENGLLTLNVSGEIKIDGGTYRELRMKGEILKTAASLCQVEKITLLIEGQKHLLPEGSSIFNADLSSYK